MKRPRRRVRPIALLSAIAVLAAGCARDPTPVDADVIVVGGGIAGLAAALESSDGGAHTIIIETSSVPGGHAVKAGGFALVGTPLQARKGFADSPDIAYDDLLAWGEDADPAWVRLFVDGARTEIHDWLTNFGIEFTILLDTPEDTVPRFHFAGGTAANVVVPMMREALRRDNVEFVLNAEATNLSLSDSDVFSVRIRSTRDGTEESFAAPAVVIATGGFQSNLDLVREHFRIDDSRHSAAPEMLLIGSGRHATGTGLNLGQSVGAQLTRMDRQVTFVNGLKSPRDPERGLHVENPAAIRVDASGRRFVNESAPSKVIEAAALNLEPRVHWLVFDDKGRKKLRIRGPVWLNRDTIANEILANAEVVHSAPTIGALADAAGLPVDSLQATIDAYNAQVSAGKDPDFGSQGTAGENARSLSDPPYYAIPLYPMTRKSMGGLAIDTSARVIGPDDRPINGLYAAGEATGVAGINGSHGGSGTFLAPSVLTGRIAGRTAAASARQVNTTRQATLTAPTAPVANPEGKVMMLAEDHARRLLSYARPGYWHWDRSHEIVLERALNCTECHSREWPTIPALTRDQKMRQFDTCSRCH